MTRGETVHTVRDVRCAPGELSFDVEVCGIEQTIWFRTDAPVTPNADAVLATCLLPAQLWGGTLEIDAPISPRLLRAQGEFQAIQGMWAEEWPYPALTDVAVRAPARPPNAPDPSRGIATFFSGGVDSWSVVAGNPDVTHLIFVRGLDLRRGVEKLADDVESRLRAAAADLGKTLYVVDTNVRELADQIHLPWDIYFASPLYAVALLLAPLFERVLVTGDTDYATNVGQGVDPLVDHLWSTETLEVSHANGRFSRIERMATIIADDPVAQRTLRVCWENPGGAYNCGRCRKCLSTMVTLEALGLRDRFVTFPSGLDLTPLSGVAIPNVLVLTLWQDILDLVRQRSRTDLEPAVAEVVAFGKRELGLPDTYRRRGATNGRVSSAEGDELQRRLDTILHSRSWRLTKPLRQLPPWRRAMLNRVRRAG